MNPKLQNKISDLIRWSQQAFSDPIAEDSMNNARKAGEALCKAIIFNFYGEILGEEIILGKKKYTGVAQQRSKELDFSGLIDLVTKEDDIQYKIINSKRIRHQIKAYLELIRTHGNPGSHDPNDPKDKIDRKHLVVTRSTLINLLNWFFEDYLDVEIPHQLVMYISQFQSEEHKQIAIQAISKYEQMKTDLRGWFEALNYKFTSHNTDNDHFEWIIEEKTRRGTFQIFIYGITEKINVQIINNVKDLVNYHDCDEGWIITNSVVEKAARTEVEKQETKTISCYTFDELLESTIDFSGYFEWLNNEVLSRGMDKNYIPLYCEYVELDSKTKNFISKSEYGENDGGIDGYVDAWLHDHRKEHLSILGEFGTGKTWFSLHYAWRLLQDYLKAKENKLPRPRIPIFIPLRDFSKAMEVETLISDFFFRKHKIEIRGVFPAFNQLNKMGKILLIFDGFDEMSDRVDKQKMIDNFWQLATIITGKSKVILTCRNEHFPQIKEGRQLLNAELKMTTKHLTDTAPQFEIVQLLRFDRKQIKKLLLLHTNKETVKRIMSHEELTDLLSRPIMTELVFDALDDIEKGKQIDMSRIYLYATKHKMERDIQQGRTFTSLADKLYFLCELSWQMLSSNKLVISYKEFPDIIKTLFIYIEDKEIDYWRNDLRSQSMLIIDEEDGNYKPAHKSLLEFFVAFKFAAHLGVLSVDFTDVAKSQSHVDSSLDAIDYTWENYFVREINSNGEVIPIPPLRSFKTSSLEKLVTLIGNTPFTRAITDLMMGMISWEENTQKTLLSIIESCRHKTFEEVGYLVSNIILILLEHKHDFFKSKNLSNLCLRNFHFPVLEYTKYNYRKKRMLYVDKFADVSGTNFENSDLCKVDFGQSYFEQNISFIKTNFSNANLENFQFYKIQLNEICLIESNGIALLASLNRLIILNLGTFKADIRSIEGETVFHISISPDEKYIFQATYGGFKVYDSQSLDITYEHQLSKQNNSQATDPNNLWTCSFAFIPNSDLLIVGRVNSFIHIIDWKNQQELNVINSFTAVSNVSVSPCGKFFISSGFHEFILWELDNFQKLMYEQTAQESLTKYVAQFHPIKSEFILLCENQVRFFDTSSMNFFHELYLDENRRSGCIAFSKDGDKLFIAQDAKVYIIDYHDKSIIQTIEILEYQFYPWFDSPKKTYHDSRIEDIAVDSMGQTLYLVHNNRCVTKVDVNTGEIVNTYCSLQDFTGADFTGAKGLNKAVIEQLYKNGAII